MGLSYATWLCAVPPACPIRGHENQRNNSISNKEKKEEDPLKDGVIAFQPVPPTGGIAASSANKETREKWPVLDGHPELGIRNEK